LPTDLATFLLDLKACRYYTFLYVSLWKIVCFFCTMLLVTYIEYKDVSDDAVGNLFTLFDDSFSQRNITVNEVRMMFTDMWKNILCLKVQQ
jgi:chitin synthase